MEKMTQFFSQHYDFIKWQSECYALAVAFFTIAVLCIKHLEALLFFIGGIAALGLTTIGVGLTLTAIDKAQCYIGHEIAPKGSKRHLLWGLGYVSTAVSCGLAIALKVTIT